MSCSRPYHHQCTQYPPSCRHSQPCEPEKSTEYFWKDYIPGKIPSDAIEGADGIYVGQVLYNGWNLPATICTRTNTAITEWSGKRVITENIKILCSNNPKAFYWEAINFNNVTEYDMRNAVKGGNQRGYDLHIGKVFHDSEWKIGKVVPKIIADSMGLQLWNRDGSFMRFTEFHILKYKPVGVPQGDYYWKNYIRDQIPCDVVEGADGKYIGQVLYNGWNLPATICIRTNTAITEWVGKRVVTENIKILCSKNPKKFYWESVDFQYPIENIMKDAVKGGNQETYDLYIGRIFDDDEWKIGKVVPQKLSDLMGLQVWDQKGGLLRFTKFHILTYRSQHTIAHEGCKISQDFYWRDYVSNIIPCDALYIAGGRYIGQVVRDSHILPGTIYPDKGTAVTELYGRKVFEKNIKILCTLNPQRFYWEKVDTDQPTKYELKNAVVGGALENLTNLYIGMKYRDGEWLISKVNTTNGRPELQLWNANGSFEKVTKFFILKYQK